MFHRLHSTNCSRLYRIFTDQHRRTLKVFSQGRANVKPVDIVANFYQHRYSHPSYKSNQKPAQSSFSFHPSITPRDIDYARPSISTWAAQLVGGHVENLMRWPTHDPLELDSFSACISVRPAAAANDWSKAKGVRVVTKEDLMSLSFSQRAEPFKACAPLVWYLTECMTAPKKNGKHVVWKRRNPLL